MRTKYDWNVIQAAYDTGMTLRQIRESFGMAWKSIGLAQKRGDFISRTQKEASVHPLKKRSTYKHTEEFKRSVSMRQSTNNSGGRCKWFEVDGHRLQGTWERDLAIKFNELGVKWRKLRLNSDVVEYTIDGKIKRYTPDFFLPDHNLYLEIKGYWWGDDKRKMEAVMTQHPEMRIFIVEKESYNKIMGGELVW